MKLPKPTEIRLGCHAYQVEFGEFIDLKDSAIAGDVNHRLALIRIRTDRPPSEQFVTLLHESTHTIARHFLEEGAIKEKDIALLAEGLAQILQSLGVEFED